MRVVKKSRYLMILLALVLLTPTPSRAAAKESCFGLFRQIDNEQKQSPKPEPKAGEPTGSAGREPLPADRDPLFGRERAQEIATATDKIGDYSLVKITLANEIDLKIVIDTKADWMTNAVEAFAKKPAAQLDQKTLKAFLEHLTRSDLRSILGPRLRMYRGLTRDMKRDGDTYYLEEMIASGKRNDLSIALIGQSLLESYAKKESRIVLIAPEGQRVSSFGLMILNGNPDVFLPGKCANKACGEKAIVQAAPIRSSPAFSTAGAKDKKQISLIDYRGQTHLIQIQSRSALERTIKEEREIYAAAGPNDLVAVELYHLGSYLAGGTTMMRVGDDIYHFGGGGWEHQTGTEGVKGFLLSHPYQKNMFRNYRGMGLPPFNVGMKLMVPKSEIAKARQLIEAQIALPDNQKPQFDFLRNNCVQALMRALNAAGLKLGTDKGFYGFSSSLNFRENFLNPQYPIHSVNIYTMPGFDLTEAQYRNEFPQFIYRAYSVKEDRRLVHLPGEAKDRYQEAVYLEAIELAGERGVSEASKLIHGAGVVDNHEEFESRLQFLIDQKWVEKESLKLTEEGRRILSERAIDYDLSAVLPR